MSESEKNGQQNTGRRGFLKGFAAVGAASVLATARSSASQEPATPAGSSVAPASDAGARAGSVPPSVEPGREPAEFPASDYMVDVLRAMSIKYVTVNPGSSFDGLQESIINYGNNSRPELLTVLHEETGAAMAHGYAKVAGEPMMTLVHGTVGLLHASMAIFQAWADRVPMLILAGNHRQPRTTVARPQSAQDLGALVRDFVKVDDEALDVEHFGSAAIRAYTLGCTPPMGPSLLVVDADLQRSVVPNRAGLRVPTLSMPSYPQGDSGAVSDAAQILVAAEYPLIRIQKYARTAAGWDALLELAELLQAPVDVGTHGSWQGFPSWHPLYGTGGPDYRPDVILGLEVNDMSAEVDTVRLNGGKTISIGSEYLYQGKNIHDNGTFAAVDLAIAADAEATLPELIEAIRRSSSRDAVNMYRTRGKYLTAAHKSIREQEIAQARHGWNASPISVPRMLAELGHQIRNDDWAIVSGHQFTGTWQRRLLNHDRHYRYNGDSGGFGIGYDTPAGVGAALAHKHHGRLPVSIVGDGDFNFVGAGALWSAAHHRIPLLTVVHNNRAFHAEVMVVQRMASRRDRGPDRSHIGTAIADPNPDYAKIAQGYGVYAEGPISDPNELGAAYQRALERVRAGEPALVDVVSQPR